MFREIREMAQAAERVGLDSIWLPDHLLYRFSERGEVFWEVFTMLSALAAVTTRITLGTIVVSTSFRPPALVAKIADTIDEVSGGRLILGLGAGWYQPEYEAFGYPFDHLASRFEEAMQIIAPLLREGQVDFQGKYYQVHNCVLRPRGPSRHGPPLLIAGRRPRMLQLAARYADACFGYGVPHTGPQWSYESPLNHPEDARRVRTQYFSSDQQRVTMAMALRGPEFSTMDVTRHDWKLACDLGLPISVHVGSGPFGVPYRAIERLSQDHLLGPDTQYVHTTTLTDEAIQLLAESGGTAVVTPAVEMQMGFGLPATHRLMAHGIRPGLGVDIVTSTAGDLFTQMHTAFQVARLQALQEGSSSPTVEDIFALATIDGARASWLDQKIGTLTPGKQADIILLTTTTPNLTPLNDPVASVVLGAHAGNVDTVLVAGKTLKQGGRLLHIDLEQIRARVTASRDYLMEASGFSKT
jgi:hypothetical protein